MFTGQISSHALHEVHAHTSSEVMRSKRLLADTVISGSTPIGGDTGGVPVRAMTSPVFSTISRGSSGLPVAWAGHTDVHRPHIVQASVSRSCFHVKSSTVEAPKLSSSVSMRFGIGRMAPLGRSRSRRYMFSGDGEDVPQHRDRQDRDEDEEACRRGRPTRPGGRRPGCCGRRSSADSG